MSSNALDLSYAVGLTVERDVPLAAFTSLKVGGPADHFVRARSSAELSRVLTEAHRRGMPWLLVGGGSNMLISDRGFRGLAIKVETAGSQRTRAEVLRETDTEVLLRCEAGALSAGLSRWTASLGFRGLEWACGIPGTIGGAAAGNAGAYGGDMEHTVDRLRAWFPDGERVMGVGELGYAYRASRFKRSPEPSAVLSVDLRLTPGSKDAALEQIEQQEARRRASQPSERSCGSVFKNPTPLFSGRVIEEAGLKGTTHGGAQISEKHGNFFVNRGGATASDVVALMRLARERVRETHGVTLEVEILLVGDWPPEEVAGL
ncbi:MAG TPA: UDP-N-acetylmuramate dehydrogenase [Chloroflexota bacterium]|jgi:UDP-N-acetylmuramate dehydrogenase|nr:UDP-N-acetylmuramate dehydrogenase [Chloroflexota bacterium]